MFRDVYVTLCKAPTCTTSLLKWKLADILANPAIKKMLMCHDGLVEDEMHLLF